MRKAVASSCLAGGVAMALLTGGVDAHPSPGARGALSLVEGQGSGVPGTPDGTPDLSGIWRAASSRHLTDLVAGNGQVVLQPWAAALYKARQTSNGKGRPSERCLPRGVPGMMLARDQPWKIVQTPGMVIILFHESLHYRQIFTDGRPFPDDPAPSWLGYSIGRWEGDTLVAETIGLTDQTWLDEGGHPHSDALRVIERFRRPGRGAMDVDITIDDPKAYTRPWTVAVRFELVQDADLGEDVCAIQPG